VGGRGTISFGGGPLGLDLDGSGETSGVVGVAAPGVLCRVLDEASLHQIAVDVLDYWTTGLLDYWTTGLLDYWTTGLLDYWTTGLLDYWTTGLLDYWTTSERADSPRMLRSKQRVGRTDRGHA